jgi:hypothetical protein
MTFMAPDFSAFTQFLQELRMMQVTPQLAQPQQQQQLPQLGQSSQPLSPNNSSSMSSHHFSLGYSNQGGFIVEKPQTSINRASRVLTSRRYSQRLFTPSGLLSGLSSRSTFVGLSLRVVLPSSQPLTWFTMLE